MRITQFGAFNRDDKITAQNQLKTACQGEPIDGRNYRHGQLLEADAYRHKFGKEGIHAAGLAPNGRVTHALKVSSGAKGPSGPGYHQNPDLGIRFSHIHGVIQFIQ